VKKVFLCGIILSLATGLASAQQMKNESVSAKPSQPASPPANTTVTYIIYPPTLVSPKDETVDITGKEKLEFRWKPYESPYYVYCFLLRIYRGSDMTQKNEVYSEQVSGLDTSTEVSTDRFKDGETYTWVIKQVNNGPPLFFSDPAIGTFAIVKKAK